MKKNVAGQKTGAQMVTAADGTAFTGSVTVSVTGDAGTQATGSVGSGACAHEGNGYHTYAPAQAETNYDLVAFTYTGTGAIPVTVQIYTSFPQSADAPTAAANADAVWDEVRSGHTTVGTFGEVVEAADVADAVLDEAMSGHVTAGTLGKAVADILVDTGEIGAAGAGLTALATAAAATAIEADTQDIQSRLPAALTAAGNIKADGLALNGATVLGAGTSGDKWRGE